MRFQSIDESETEFGGKKIAFTSAADWFGRVASNRMTAVSGSANLGSVSHSYTYKETSSTATEYIDTYTSTVTPVSGTKTDTIYRYTYDNNGNIRTITKDGILSIHLQLRRSRSAYPCGRCRAEQVIHIHL